MKTLGLRSAYFTRSYTTAMKHYNANKVMEIISLLRTYDAKSKGIDNISASSGELLKELVYKIMH
jgi:DNA polymerase-3 subunit delta